MLFTSLFLALCCGVLIALRVRDRKMLLQFSVAAVPEQDLFIQSAQMLAHDMRKPFSLLRAVFSHLEQSKGMKDDFLKRNRASLETSIRDVEAFLEDMLNLGKTTKVTRLPTSLRKVVYDSVNQQLVLSSPCRTKISYEFSNTFKAMVDGQRIKRVVDNLISNAVQACDGTGSVTVRIEEVDGELKLTVFNTGSYIPVEKRERVFDAFFTDAKANGTGLGLCIAKEIVEKNGGKIWVESDLERGTSFVFTLPLSNEADQAVSELSMLPAFKPAAPAQAHTEQARLVVVEDEVFLRSMWMEIGKHAVKAFRSPSELMNYCELHPDFLKQIDCVVTDYHFVDADGLTGIDVANSLREAGYSKKIFLSSEMTTIQSGSHLFHGRVDKDPHVALKEAFLN